LVEPGARDLALWLGEGLAPEALEVTQVALVSAPMEFGGTLAQEPLGI
jgi:hypothetical protein